MKTAIEVTGLTYQYQAQHRALEDIHLQVAAGEMVALLGQNGAGKTTLVKHFIGLLKPPPGRVQICGLDVAHTPISQLAQEIGFVFQNPDHQIFHETVQQEVAFGLKNIGLAGTELTQRVAEALGSVGLEDLAGHSPHRLSRGQRQRVALASVLAMRTKLIVLDEPTTGQDHREKLQIMSLLKSLNQQGHTILFITHDMSLVAQYARRVLVLCQGRLTLDGPTREVFRHEPLLKEAQLEVPPITQLANQLYQTGQGTGGQVILTVEEMVSHLQRRDSNGPGS